MEQLNIIKATIITIIGTAGTFIVNLFGGWTEDLTTLIILMGIDYAMGIAIAIVWKTSNKSKTGALSSVSAWKGLCRKGGSLLVVLVAHRLDVTLGISYIKTAVIIAFIANEAISIVENLGIMGIKFPAIINQAIEVLQKKTEEEVEENANIGSRNKFN